MPQLAQILLMRWRSHRTPGTLLELETCGPGQRITVYHDGWEMAGITLEGQELELCIYGYGLILRGQLADPQFLPELEAWLVQRNLLTATDTDTEAYDDS